MAAAYGGAAFAVLAAIGLRWLLGPWLGAEAPYILVFGAVAVAVWLGGAGPALFAAVLGYLLVNYLYLEPVGSLAIGHARDVLQLVLFTLACALVIGLGQGMRRARDRARASDVRKSEFLAVLSHELRNPLAPLRAAVEIMKLKSEGAPLPGMLEMMERQIAHLGRLIDDLLDVSRIDRGTLKLRIERVALDSVLRSAVETAMPAIDEKSHELVLRDASEALYVEGDAVRLGQVLSNLLNNAAKFTPAGGRIELATRAESGHAVISVVDRGIGLAPEHLERVFDLFAQVQPRSGGGGLGLGLALARSIVRLHGGEVHARSAGVGRGAEFIVRLPLAAGRAAEAPRAQAPDTRVATPRRVLVVDDNADAAHTLGELLRLWGHRVAVATNGAEALRAAEESPPEIAFIDLDMPGVDGFEVGRRLKEHGVRIIALTGMGQQADIARTREAGFHAHLTKPADPRAVADLLSESEAAGMAGSRTISA
jgi:signal transduction histidine kinase/CheY-like chemotaxis protein